MSRYRWYGATRKKWRKRPLGILKGLIWPVGLLVLFVTGAWWPGILILVGLSMVLDTLGRIAETAPAAEPEPPVSTWRAPEPPADAWRAPEPPPATSVAPVVPPEPPAPAATFDLRGLPNTCPQCGGPLSPKTARALAPNLAECPWCGSRLPL